MNKISLAFLFLFILIIDLNGQGVINISEDKQIEKILTITFKNEDYNILKKSIQIGNVELFVAVKYIDSKNKTFSKGIGFEVKENVIVPHIFFEKAKILNKKMDVIVDYSKKLFEPYGWQLSYSIPKSHSKSGNGFQMTLISDKGNRVTDGPLIVWDKEKELFIEYAFDMNMFD